MCAWNWPKYREGVSTFTFVQVWFDVEGVGTTRFEVGAVGGAVERRFAVCVWNARVCS